MNKVYNLKQDTFIEHQELDERNMYNENDRRKNELLNGFVLIIGIVGFLAAFFLPRDLVYNRSSLENSFSNSSPLASSSLPKTKVQKNANILDIGDHFLIDGFMEVNEVLSFNFDSFQSNSDVDYTIYFGNGDRREIQDQITHFSYNDSGTFLIKVIAKYGDEEKEIFEEEIFIDEAIIVNTEAFVEHN